MKKKTLEKIKENTRALEMIQDGLNILQKNMVSRALRIQLLIIRAFFHRLNLASLTEIMVLKDKDEFNGIVKNLEKESKNEN